MADDISESFLHIFERNEEYFPGMSRVAELIMAPPYLQAMGEPPLPGPAGSDGYRLLRLPSFRPSVAVRVIGDPIERLVARAWMGRPAEGHGRRILDHSRSISPEERESLQTAVEGAGFWRLPPTIPVGGLDGEYWILEGRRGSEHHVVVRWSPEPDGPDAPFLALCMRLLALAPPVVVPKPSAKEQREIDARREAAYAESERQDRLRSATILRENAAAERVKTILAATGRVTCPHCSRSVQLRFKDRGTSDASYFVCGDCGRSATGTEVENGLV